MRRCSKIRAVEVFNYQSKYRIQTKSIQKLSTDILFLLKEKAGLQIALVNDTQIRRVNKLYHGADCATDVLAFEPPEDEKFQTANRESLGEIIISLDRAAFYARQFNISMDEELVRYVIHGILHLLGERDQTKTARKKMHSRQEAVLAALESLPRLVTK